MSHAAITTPDKEWRYISLSPFHMGKNGNCFSFFSVRTPLVTFYTFTNKRISVANPKFRSLSLAMQNRLKGK